MMAEGMAVGTLAHRLPADIDEARLTKSARPVFLQDSIIFGAAMDREPVGAFLALGDRLAGRLVGIHGHQTDLPWRRPERCFAQARVTLPAAFAETTVIVELLSPSEVRIREVDETPQQNAGSDDLMKLAESSGAFDFWNDPAEDICGPDDGEPR